MKRHLSIAVLSVWLPAVLAASPSAIYENPGIVTAATNIDAIIFYNLGQFNVSGLENATNFALGANAVVVTGLPFTTRDTLYYTNLGTMVGTPGFLFDTSTGTTRHSASIFYNADSVTGIDVPAIPTIIDNLGGTLFTQYPAGSLPLSSGITVNATNIINEGSIAVGDAGIIKLTGRNVNLANGSVIAGSVSDNAANDTTGGGGFYEELDDVLTKTGEYFVDPLEVYDLFSGTTNNSKVDPLSLAFPASDFGLANGWVVEPPFPGQILGNRTDGLLIEDLLLTNMTAYAYGYIINNTNVYLSVVFVNTNFADSNISANVLFGPVLTETLDANSLDPNGIGEIVQFTESALDLSTGTTVSNSIYVLDSGSELTNNYAAATNAAYSNGYGRPDRLSITTSRPLDFFPNPNAAFFSLPFDPSEFYVPQEFTTEPVPMDFGVYGAQVGRNPEQLDGLDPLTAESLLLLQGDDLPALTNEPGRVEINAQSLNLAGTRIQASGVVTLNATNITGAPFGSDWGDVNSALGSRTNGLLLISNVFPTTFHRLRGDVTAWCASWVNTQTNDFFGDTNAAFSVTNIWHFHVLVVNQDLRGQFRSSALNLSLRGNNVVVDDSLRVMNNALIGASNLTLNGSNVFTQNASSLTAANLPGLQNLLVNTSGSLTADNEIDIGYDLSTGTTSPSGRTYAVSSVTNLGAIGASVALFDCARFENDGSITVTEGGTMTIEANALGMGLDLTNRPNSLEADGSITLSANSIRATNSTIKAGNTITDQLGQLILDTGPTGTLTDFVPGTSGTNQHLVNLWQVTGGFSLLQKPASGDLFGTEITSIGTGFNVANHIWAGTDYSNNIAAGFSNNVVIGHLKLSRRTATAELHFAGAGARNGMYVDYLELDPASLSYSDYRHGMVIDPNLTIYFADSNVDPFKLQDAYPNRMVWVPTFAGPNSTLAVPYVNSSNLCLMNAALATSQDISFFPGTPPNFFNQPYVLNNPGNPADTYPCPGTESADQSFLLISGAGGGPTPSIAMISVLGDGRITPSPAHIHLVAGKLTTLTATPSSGWIFSQWNVSGLVGDTIKGNVLKFTPGTNIANIMIQAVFVVNPFIPLQGAYNGLFYDTNEVNQGQSGFVTLTLRPSGAFSGQLLMGPQSYAFSSNFDSTGARQMEVKHKGQPTLTLNLQLLPTNGAGAISGTVSNAAWDAPSPLWADLGLTWKGKNHSPWAGTYTASLPWGANVPFAGDSYATALVYDSGLLTAIGGLADGTSISQTVPISKEGLWPFYAYNGAAKNLILGWVTFGTNGMTSTNVTWGKAANKGKYYKEGFTNVLQLQGSPYREQDPPLELTNPVVILSGGDLALPLTNNAGLKNNLTYTSSIVALHIQAVAGSFSGTFTNNGQREIMSGVILQNSNGARGYFLGNTNNGSGGILLQSQ